MSNHNTYAICSLATDLSNINFNEIPETSADTIRKSINETLFVIKWITEPAFVTDGTVTPSAVMNHADALTLMATPAWTDPNGPH